MRGGGVRRRGARGGIEAAASYTGDDTSLPGLPDGYAAADDGCAGSGTGNEYRDGEYFREPF